MAVEEIESLPDRKTRRRIVRRIGALGEDPRPRGSLTGSDLYRVRVGRYRILDEIRDDRLVVLDIKAGHRGDVCRSRS